MADRIEGYLARLQAALRVSLELRERILCETEDHLREAAEREQARGLPPDEAQRRVIERFGEPEAAAQWWSEIYPRENGGGRMWQRFTERARRVVYYAQEEGARLGTNMVDTEHLLLGLVRERDSVAGRLLEERLGVSLSILRSDTEKQTTRGPGHVGQDMQLTPTAKHMIDLAYEEARSLMNNYIGTEHLLLGLIVEEEGLGGRVLRGRGIGLERTRQAVRSMQESESDEALIRGVKAQFALTLARAVTLPPEALALIEVLNMYAPEQLVPWMLSHLRLTEAQRQELDALGTSTEQLNKLNVWLQMGAVGVELAGQIPPSLGETRPYSTDEPPAVLSQAAAPGQAAEAVPVTGLASLAEGQVYSATVRQVADTGAVVQIGDISAWLPREEMSWPPVRRPSQVVKSGEEIEVMVLQLDRLRGKVVVGLRLLVPDEPAGG
jgi:hypothetical protein